MLLGSSPAYDPDLTDVPLAAIGGHETGGDLLARVMAAFPALHVTTSRVERAGGDHVLLIVDDRYAFRFPRARMHGLGLEIEVLRRLRERSALRVPCYDHVDPQGRFAGYRFIAGNELTATRFAALSTAARDTVLAQAARFLTDLHGLSVEAVAWAGTWPTMWTAERFAGRGLRRLPLIARHMPRLARPIEAFYDGYRHDRPPGLVILHGDLVADHILFDETTGGLAGIIDFGDVALGDAAYDFAGLWTYGAPAAARATELYRPIDADPGLLGRARNHHVRARIDRLFELLRDGLGALAHDEAIAIDTLLSQSAAYT